MNPAVRAVLQSSALAYLAARPWESLRDEHIFGVKDSETGLEGWASVAGNAGEEFGLGIYLGRDGQRLLEKILALDVDIERQNQASDVIALTVADEAEISNFRAGTRLDERATIGTKQVVPVVFRKPPGDEARALRDREATFLARVLTAITKTREWGLGPDDVLDERGGRLILTVKGPLASLEIDRGFEAPPAVDAMPPELEEKLREAPRTKRLLVGYRDGVLVLLDPRERDRVHRETLSDDSPAVATRRLIELLSGSGPIAAVLPREIWTDAPSLESTAGAVLAPFGVKVVAKLELKELKRRS